MVRTTRMMRMLGTSKGSVTLKNPRMGPAPSTRAASWSSRGMVCMPASTRNAASGVVFHTSATITMFSARNGLPSQDR